MTLTKVKVKSTSISTRQSPRQFLLYQRNFKTIRERHMKANKPWINRQSRQLKCNMSDKQTELTIEIQFVSKIDTHNPIAWRLHPVHEFEIRMHIYSSSNKQREFKSKWVRVAAVCNLVKHIHNDT